MFQYVDNSRTYGETSLVVKYELHFSLKLVFRFFFFDKRLARCAQKACRSSGTVAVEYVQIIGKLFSHFPEGSEENNGKPKSK